MEKTDRTNINELCFSDDPAFCMAACPVDLDIRSFVGKMQAGNFDAAYQEFRQAVYFPETVCRICDRPCEKACALCDKTDALSVRNLERAACAYAQNKEGKSFYLPPKKKVIAVIGAGLAGAACACKLAKKAYLVDLYDERDYPGGCLNDADDPSLPEMVREEMEAVLKAAKIRLHLGERIDSLESLEADVVYIATGADGSRFGLDAGWDPVTLATDQEGVFLTNNKRVHDLALSPLKEGLAMADTLISYLKINKVMGSAGDDSPGKTGLFMKPDGTRCAPELPDDISGVVTAQKGELYSKEEAVEEAGRCILCSCENCIQSCELLRTWNSTPQRIVNDIKMTVTSIPDLTSHAATRKMASCNLCGLCRDSCPAGVDFEKVFMDGRRAMHQRGEFPPAFHDFWMRDMAFSQSDECFLLLPEEKNCDYLFFPGCQLAGSDPNYVVKVYAQLRELFGESVGLLLSCCGAPAYWAGREEEHKEVLDQIRGAWEKVGKPKMITSCLSCDKIFEETMSEIPRVSLYSLLADNIPKESEDAPKRTVSVFDPCASRGKPDVQSDVRKILSAMNFDVKELVHSGEKARCCGNGGHIYATAPDLVEENVRQCVEESDEDYIVYCANCREFFAFAGKPAMHILDLFLDEPFDQRMSRPAVSLSDSRDNRRKLRSIMIKEYGNSTMDNTNANEKRQLNITFTDEILKKMDRELITRDDIISVIYHCEETGKKVLDMEAGYYIGYDKVGEITLWVIYMPDGKDSFYAMGFYTHRMSVGEA